MNPPVSPDLLSSTPASPHVEPPRPEADGAESHRAEADGGVRRLVSDESWRHLGMVEWARIGFTTYEGIQILPVQYVLDEHTLVFSTPAGGVLAQLADLTCQVACEVDRQSADATASWHVLMHGMITHHAPSDQEDFPAESRTETVRLQFKPSTMAGHRF